MKSNTYLSTECLSSGYHGHARRRDIALHVKRGEIMVLIGPNGAGKSTLLKTLARHLPAVSGAVLLDGALLWELSGVELARKLSIVTTERIEPELMTCADVVRMGRYPYTGQFGLLRRADEALVMQALSCVHGEDLADLPFTQVSDGQRQKVLLARALCQQPDIILLDEPTSFLDIRHKIELLDILKTLVRKQNLAVVMSLHELDLAQKIADKVVCVSHDEVRPPDTPERIFSGNVIHKLYGLEKGSYNALFGSAELEAVLGKPRVFVIGGGGSGIPIYRKLQRMGIPFAAGILAQNDLDYPVAKALASSLIETPPYAPADNDTYNAAVKLSQECESVVCTLQNFGPLNECNAKLWEVSARKADWRDL